MDLLEHGRPERDGEVRPIALPRAGAAGVVALALSGNLLAAGAAVVRHETPAGDVATAAATPAGRSIPGVRRAVSLPPDRPRRSSPAHLPGGTPAEVPRLGTVTGVTGAAASRELAMKATYAMAERLCRDVSLVRLRLLRRTDDWTSVAYFVRVYEQRPPEGSFVVQLSWTGRDYEYLVTGKGGECADKGTG